MASVSLKTIIDKMKLTNLTPELDIKKIRIIQPDINRPALQLAGYYEHFEATSRLIYGLKYDCSKEAIRDAIEKGELERHLRYYPIKKNDVFFIEAGTIHAWQGISCLFSVIRLYHIFHILVSLFWDIFL